jgi:hypothetical protein
MTGLSSNFRYAFCKTRYYCRSLAAISALPPHKPHTLGPFEVFDRSVKRLQKDRAAARDGGRRSRTADYVRDEVADRMMERLLVSDNLSVPLLCLGRVLGYKAEIRYNARPWVWAWTLLKAPRFKSN